MGRGSQRRRQQRAQHLSHLHQRIRPGPRVLYQRAPQHRQTGCSCLFGDHQPSAATTLNDELYPQEDTASHAFRIYQSTYLVWANYEIAGNTELNVYDTVGANEIAAITLNKIGAPLTNYQKALLATRSDVPTINVAGYLGADGLRYDLESEDSPYASTIDKLQRMQYLEFASKVQ